MRIQPASWLEHPNLFDKPGTSLGTEATGAQIETSRMHHVEAGAGNALR